MSFFPHNQPFDDGFLDRGIPQQRGSQELRNIQQLRPSIEQDINSRGFDARRFSDQRSNLDFGGGNPPFRPQQQHQQQHHQQQQQMDRLPTHGRGMDFRIDPRTTDLRQQQQQQPHQLPQHHQAPQHQHLDVRPNELRTYDRPTNPQQRVDPRINFSVGLPSSLGTSSLLPPPALGHQGLHPQPQQATSLAQPSQALNPQQPQHLPHSSPLQLSSSSPFGGSLLGQFTRPSVTEVVPVHVDLAAFAAEPKFQQILLKVKEQSLVNFISLNRIADDLVESIVIDAPTRDAALLARNLIETHLKLQMKIKAAENRLQRVQTDLFSTQGEIAAGQMVEFMIRPELIGLAIGKKGARIKQIETETGVSSINVSDNGHIMIYGPDSQSVQRAREQLELKEESFPLSRPQMEWMIDKLNAAIVADLKSGSGVMVAKVNRDTCQLDVVGTSPSVKTAKFLLATQLEYVDKQIEIETNEREARDKLNAVRKQYGLNNPQWKNRNVGPRAGGRGNSPEDSSRGMDAQLQYQDKNNKGNKNNSENVVDSLVRAAMTGNVRTKSAEKDSLQGTDDSLPMNGEDELDALISYPPENPQTKKQPESKVAKQQRKAKDLVVQDTILGMSMEPAEGVNQKKGGKEKDRERDKSNKKQDRSVEKQDKNKGKQNDKAAEKQAALKVINSDSGLLVIPPAPVLVVPPPPPAGTQEKGNKGKKGKKNENRDSGDKPALDSPAKEEKKKEPMLVKINNPFLEQKGRKSEDASEANRHSAPSRVVSIVPESAETNAVKKQERLRSKSDRDEHPNAMPSLKIELVDSRAPENGENQKKNKRGKNNKKQGVDKEEDLSPVHAKQAAQTSEVVQIPSKTESPEGPRKILQELEKNGPDADFHQQLSEPPLPPRRLKKGPPAIPNKVLDDDIVPVDSSKANVAPGSSGSTESQSASVDSVPALSSPTNATKKAVPPPPGLAVSSQSTQESTNSSTAPTLPASVPVVASTEGKNDA